MGDWSTRDWMVVGGGAVALIASFLDYVGVTFRALFVRSTISIDAWHSYAVVGVLLVVAAAALWAVRLLGNVTLPAVAAGWGSVTTVAAGLGSLLIIVRAFSYPAGVGVEFGGWLLILASLVVTAGAGWALRVDAASAGGAGAGPGVRVPGGSPFGAPPAGAPDWLSGRRPGDTLGPGRTGRAPPAPGGFSPPPAPGRYPPPPTGSPLPPAAGGSGAAARSVAEQLAEADRLLVEGAITEGEYQVLRSRIIAGE